MPPQSVQPYLQPMQGPLQHQPVLLTQSSFGSQQGHAGPMIQGSTQHTMLPTQQAPPLQPMDPTTYGHSTQTPTPNYMPTHPPPPLGPPAATHIPNLQPTLLASLPPFQYQQHPPTQHPPTQPHFGHLRYNPPAQAHPSPTVTTTNNTRNVHTPCTLFTTSTSHAAISTNRPHPSTTYDPNLRHPTTCASHSYFCADADSANTPATATQFTQCNLNILFSCHSAPTISPTRWAATDY